MYIYLYGDIVITLSQVVIREMGPIIKLDETMGYKYRRKTHRQGSAVPWFVSLLFLYKSKVNRDDEKERKSKV